MPFLHQFKVENVFIYVRENTKVHVTGDVMEYNALRQAVFFKIKVLNFFNVVTGEENCTCSEY